MFTVDVVSRGSEMDRLAYSGPVSALSSEDRRYEYLCGDALALVSLLEASLS